MYFSKYFFYDAFIVSFAMASFNSSAEVVCDVDEVYCVIYGIHTAIIRILCIYVYIR